MQELTQLRIAPVALLVLPVLLAYLAVHRNGLTAPEADGEVVGTVAQLEGMVVRDAFAVVAFLVLLASFAFVAWTVLRPKGGKGKAVPPAGESSATDRAASP
jgi:hypothetical protein